MNQIPIEIEKSYNLCPICGLPSKTTALICPTHLSITYDSFGHPISWVDWKPEKNTFIVYGWKSNEAH